MAKQPTKQPRHPQTGRYIPRQGASRVIRDAQQAEPGPYVLQIDVRLLTPHEYNQLKRIAAATAKRELGQTGTMGELRVIDSG